MVVYCGIGPLGFHRNDGSSLIIRSIAPTTSLTSHLVFGVAALKVSVCGLKSLNSTGNSMATSALWLVASLANSIRLPSGAPSSATLTPMSWLGVTLHADAVTYSSAGDVALGVNFTVKGNCASVWLQTSWTNIAELLWVSKRS